MPTSADIYSKNITNSGTINSTGIITGAGVKNYGVSSN